jgi:4-amino-4-deoxy-L-arabinose transferase-like glycosyltransferase
MTRRHHTVLATILVVMCAYLVRLSMPEMQPNEEAFHAVRGKAAVVFGAWADQAPQALGGLYSASAPPLTAWLVAAGITIAGPSDTAVRLPFVLVSALALFVLFFVAERLVSFRGAITAVLALGTSLPWAVLARSALPDVVAVTMSLLALYATLRYHDSNTPWSLGLYAVALAGVLLSQPAVAVVCVLFIVPYIVDHLRTPSRLLWPLASVIAGTLLAMPWYGAMVGRYGDQFWLSFMLPFGLSFNGLNVKGLGLFATLWSVLTTHPLTIVAIVGVPFLLFKRSMLPAVSHRPAVMVLLWFAVVLVGASLFSFEPFRLALHILPPSALVAVWLVERMRTQCDRRVQSITYALVIASSILTMASPAWLHAFSIAIGGTDVAALFAAVALVLVAAAAPQRWANAMAIRGSTAVVAIAIGVGAVRVGMTIMSGWTGAQAGGREVAANLIDIDVRQFAVLFHQQSASDAFAGQLAWYMGRRMTGWMPGYGYKPVALPADAPSVEVDALAYGRRYAYVVYHTVGASADAVSRVQTTLSMGYDVILDTGHYVLYRRRG